MVGILSRLGSAKQFVGEAKRNALARVKQLKSEILMYLKSARTMQLATAFRDQPWVCTVYFVYDNEMNIYWLSLPTRRHSRELAINPFAAIAFQIKTDLPVIGIQAEGAVTKVIDPKLIKKISKSYEVKYDSGKEFYKNFMDQKNQHHMYKLTPKRFVVFDEVNYPSNARREYSLNQRML